MENLIGKKFGMLTVTDFSHKEKSNQGIYKYYWICKCECGNVVTRRSDGLKLKNRVVSCGCYARQMSKEHFTRNNPKKTHGQTKTRLYKIYAKMKERCYDPNYPQRNLYGGRGIKICKEWLDSFENFRDWAIKNGYSDDLSIDRIDANGDYEPSNCRWADKYQQANNKRNNIVLTYNGETLTMPQWARKLNMPYSTLADRRKKGKSVEEILYPHKLR